MPTSFDQLLPSLEALGMWSYWIIGGAALLEAFIVTAIFVPGTLVVVAGGMLVQQGVLDFFDLAWFVAIGSVLGGEASYWVGMLARKGLQSRWQPEQSLAYLRAERLFRRRGGFALILGRFLGPVSGLISFAASVSGMKRKKFSVWNTASGIPFALVLVSSGYFLGDALTRLGPLATRFALVAGGALLVLVVLWWLVVRIARSLPFLLSILRSVVGAIAENPDVRAWTAKHPRMTRFFSPRFDRTRFGGLTATLLAVIAAYIFVVWAGSALDFLHVKASLEIDMRLANLAHAFWTPGMLWFFAHVTALGDWRVVWLILLAALSVLLMQRRFGLALGLVAALLGNIASVSFLKWIFNRPRPDLAYFVETSGSFPSGHAAISVAFFGMLFFVGWRLKWVGPVVAAVLAASLAFLIGLSRLYLIEHYLSDVLNGWLVGGVWLVIGIAVAQWWCAARPTHSPLPDLRGRLLLGLAAFGLLAGAVWVVAGYDKTRGHPEISTQTETVIAPEQIFATGNAPVSTQSIGGTKLEPINLIIVASDILALDAAMEKAGWIKARKPGLASVSRAAWAAFANAPDQDAPVTPYFWNGVPNDVAYERPTNDNSQRQRHHVRFWQSRFLTQSGGQIFVGAASFDNGLDWTLLHHIDPNIDAERNILAKDLQQAGVVVTRALFDISPPHMGQSVAGDPWFTDGKAVVITLR